MARIDNLNNFLTDVALSIKNKTGKTETLYPVNFDTEINSIQSKSKYPPIILNITGSYTTYFYDCGAYFNNMDELVIYAIPATTNYENVKFVTGSSFIGTKWLGWDKTNFSNSSASRVPQCCYIRGLFDKKCLSVTLNINAQDDTKDYRTITVSIEELDQDPGTRALVFNQTNVYKPLTVKIDDVEFATVNYGKSVQIPIGANVSLVCDGSIDSNPNTYYCWLKPDYVERTSSNQFIMPDVTVSVHAYATGCFIAGTPILMADNTYKNIENIQIEEKVMGYNLENQSLEEQIVENVFVREVNELTTITTQYNSIVCTTTHEIYCVNKSKYVPAYELQIGDILKTSIGTTTIIDITTNKTEGTKVYNLDTENANNYFVTEENVLVHNIS